MDYQSLLYKAAEFLSQSVHKSYTRGDKYKQLKDRITSKQLTSEFGMEEPLEDLVMEYRLRWLGHLGRKGRGKTTKDDIAWRAGKEDMGRGVGPIRQVRRSPDQY